MTSISKRDSLPEDFLSDYGEIPYCDKLHPVAALQIFRLIQEALTNVRKHSRAGEVTVSLTPIGRDDLQVTIFDNGKGFTPENHLFRVEIGGLLNLDDRKVRKLAVAEINLRRCTGCPFS